MFNAGTNQMITRQHISVSWFLRVFLLYCMLAVTSLIGQQSASAQSQKLETEPLEIVTERGNFSFEVEIADQAVERTIGLMNRSELEPRGGMLFVFDRPHIIEMWMKNTLISLDMIFVDKSGKVVSIAERTTPHSEAVISSGVPASFVLEIAGGMAAFIGIKPGNQLKHKIFEPKDK